MSDDLNPSAEPQNQPIEPSPSGEPAGQPSGLTLNDTDLLPIKVGGKEELIPWNKAREGFQLHADYTRSKQALAEERRAWESERQQMLQQSQQAMQRYQQVQQILTNPQQRASLFYALQAQESPQPSTPQPFTTEQLPQLQQGLQQWMQEQFTSWQNQQTSARAAERIEQTLESHLKQGLLPKYPELGAIDGIEDVIYGRVAALRPTSEAEAKDQMRTIIEGMNSEFQRRVADQRKAEALQRSQATNGIEPRGGQAVFPDLGKTKWEDMDEALIRFLESQDSAG